MQKSRNPPKFYTFEVFDTNLEQFGGALSERATNWLAQSVISDCPAVISPLHSPENGKEHVHVIVDLTNSEFRDKGSDWFTGLCRQADLPRPETVKNVFSMELYLTHDTLQAQRDEKQRFTPEERETMVFLNGYTMHELTDKGGRSEVSKVISYISIKLLDLIDNGLPCNTRALTKAIRDPAFYDELDCSLSAVEIIGKGLHEIKTNFRYYMQYVADAKDDKQAAVFADVEKQRQEDMQAFKSDKSAMVDYMLAVTDSMSDNQVQWFVNQLYVCCDSVKRAIVNNCGALINCNYRPFIVSYLRYLQTLSGAHCKDLLRIYAEFERFVKAQGLCIGIKF